MDLVEPGCSILCSFISMTAYTDETCCSVNHVNDGDHTLNTTTITTLIESTGLSNIVAVLLRLRANKANFADQLKGPIADSYRCESRHNAAMCTSLL